MTSHPICGLPFSSHPPSRAAQERSRGQSSPSTPPSSSPLGRTSHNYPVIVIFDVLLPRICTLHLLVPQPHSPHSLVNSRCPRPAIRLLPLPPRTKRQPSLSSLLLRSDQIASHNGASPSLRTILFHPPARYFSTRTSELQTDVTSLWKWPVDDLRLLSLLGSPVSVAISINLPFLRTCTAGANSTRSLPFALVVSIGALDIAFCLYWHALQTTTNKLEAITCSPPLLGTPLMRLDTLSSSWTNRPAKVT